MTAALAADSAVQQLLHIITTFCLYSRMQTRVCTLCTHRILRAGLWAEKSSRFRITSRRAKAVLRVVATRVLAPPIHIPNGTAAGVHAAAWLDKSFPVADAVEEEEEGGSGEGGSGDDTSDPDEYEMEGAQSL